MTGDDARPKDQVWRRRERALAAGLLMWVTVLTFTLTFHPEAVIDYLLEYEPGIVAGTILVSVGVCGGVAEGVLIAANSYITTDNTGDLTEVPWDE